MCPQGCRRRTSRSFQVSVLVEMRGPGDMLLEEHGGFLRGGGGGLDRRGRPLHAKCSAPRTSGPAVLRSPVCSEPSSGLLVESIHLRRIRLLTLRGWGCWPQGPKTVWTQLVSARGLGCGEGRAGKMGECVSCDGDTRAPSRSAHTARRTDPPTRWAGVLGVRCAGQLAGCRAAADLNCGESQHVGSEMDRSNSGMTRGVGLLCQGLSLWCVSDLLVAALP